MRLFAEAAALEAKSGQKRRSRTESDSQDAQLAYLLDLALADDALDTSVRAGLKASVKLRNACRGAIGPLSEEVAPLARSLNLHPTLFALMICHWREERDKGAKGPVGLDDWYDLSDEAREVRVEVLKEARELAGDLEFSVRRLNEDVETCIKLAIKKSVDIKSKLEVLKKKVQSELGRRRKLFHHYSKRDLEAFYLRRMRGLEPSHPRILGLYNDSNLDLSIKENRDRIKRYASDRISEVASRLGAIVRPLEEEIQTLGEPESE